MNWRNKLLALAPFAVTLFIWECTALVILHSRGVAFPTPLTTVLRLFELASGLTLQGHSLSTHILASLQRWLVGFSFASSLGVTYGLLAGRFPLFAKITAGIPQALLLMPGLAWVPIAILLLGIGEASTIFMIAIAAFAPIAINVQAGISQVDVNTLRAAQMLGATEKDLFLKVLVPAALPTILNGLEIGLGTGWRVLVAAEMVVGTGIGLGYSIIQARWTLDYASSFACIAVICGIGILSDHLLFKRLKKTMLRRWDI